MSSSVRRHKIKKIVYKSWVNKVQHTQKCWFSGNVTFMDMITSQNFVELSILTSETNSEIFRIIS